MEKWIKGYEGMYSVSDDGTVYSHNYRRTGKKVPLIVNEHSLNARSVVLCVDGKKRYCTVSRLVAETFIPNPDNLPCVCFLDGNVDNASASNLAWCTRSFYLLRAFDRRRSARG